MGLSITLTKSQPTEVFERGITHNLVPMAKEANLYNALWRGNEIANCAEDLISPLTEGLAKLKSNPEYFKQYNPSNGWGTYEDLIEYTEKYLQACKRFPDAIINIWR
jgi:hypothetical protein